MIDFIGDVHGHADKLEALLKKLGYKEQNGAFSHKERKVLFLGDYIDRGPEIVRTLEIVKAMVDKSGAIALMGNHEYNALCYNLKDAEGNYLREHSEKNTHQHKETLKQFENHKEEYKAYIEWFKTLPLYYETKEFRAVHACWDNKNINYLRTALENDRLNDELIRKSVNKSTDLYNAIEETLKGKEISLPSGSFFEDKDGTKRTEIRIKWWENPENKSYKEISVEEIPDFPLAKIDLKGSRIESYYSSKKKVFFGHYWLKDDSPSLRKENVCCLDYSVAKEGFLTAYQLDESAVLNDSKIVYVK